MRNRMMSAFLLAIPAIILLNPQSTSAAAPTPTVEREPGVYIGWINMTTMHQFSTSAGSISTSFYIDMINSTGSMEIQLLSDNRNYIHVELPVPIDFQTTMDINDDKSECKGYTINSGAASGKAVGTAINMPLLPLGSYTMSAMTFGLSGDPTGSYSPKGKCPSVDWKASTKKSISADFVATFGSRWSFTSSSPRSSGMAGTCTSETFGKSKGQSFQCSWRVYRVPGPPAK